MIKVINPSSFDFMLTIAEDSLILTRLGYRDIPTLKYRLKNKNQLITRIHLKGGYYIECADSTLVKTSDLNTFTVGRWLTPRVLNNLEKTVHLKPVGELKVGDFVLLPFGSNFSSVGYKYIEYKSKTIIFDELIAEFLGIYHSCGKISSQKYSNCVKLIFSKVDEELQLKIAFLVRRIFNEFCTRRAGSVDVYLPNDCWVNEYLVKKDKKNTLHKLLLKSPLSVICYYIKGLTVSSSFDYSKSRLSITCSDESTFLFVKCFLLNVGIISGNKLFINKPSNNKCKRITVSCDMFKKFMNLVGTEKFRYINLESIYGKIRLLNYHSYYYAGVDRIEKIRKNTFTIPLSSAIINGVEIYENEFGK